MIKYDWLRIFKKSEGHPTAILNIIAYITFDPIPKNAYDPIKKYTQIDWDGDSFLLNPSAVLFNRKKVSEKDLAEYVALASFRSLAEYKVTGRKTLSVMECPVSLETVNRNPLLSVSEGKIYFCWEETTH